MISRLGIIGDVHAEHAHLAIALDYLQRAKVDAIVCTGDIVDGKGNVSHCCAMLAEHGVRTVRGNHDRWLVEGKARHVANAHLSSELDDFSLNFLNELPTQISLATTQGQLLLCHGVANNDLQKIWPGTKRMPIERSSKLDEIIASGEFTYMINGHVHYRTMINFHTFTLFNAGTLKGDHRPGFSILDCENETLTGFEFHPQLRQVRCIDLSAPPERVFVNTLDFDGDWQPITLYA